MGANNKVYAKTDISNFEQNKKNKMKRPQFLPQMGTQSESRDFRNARLQMYQLGKSQGNIQSYESINSKKSKKSIHLIDRQIEKRIQNIVRKSS